MLEERGCRVLASEFNDFGGRLDVHSYEACLSNIENADYFVLLIGARVGGWYDAARRISITQQEYRTAYRLHHEGKIKIVAFVRQDVWQLKEERKDLERFLMQVALDESEKKAIVGSPSKFANDAEFIAKFITEVGKNLETGRAVQTGAVRPTGNWIHQFHDFRDIHEVLYPLAFTGLTSEEAAYRAALQGELLSVMSHFLGKWNGKVVDYRGGLRTGLADHPLTLEAREKGWLTVDLDKWGKFTTIFYQVLGLTIETLVIADALTSTIFLTYSRDKGAYVQSQAYVALIKLVEEIRRFNGLINGGAFTLLSNTSPRALGRKTGNYDMPIDGLGLVYGLAHRWINIVSLCEALIVHLEGAAFSMPELMPFSPVIGMEEKILAERVSVAELRDALRLG